MKSNGLYCLVARPKVSKSLLVLPIANSLVNNKQFLGFDINPSPVLYISTKLSEKQLNERIEVAGYNFGNSLFFVEKDSNHSLSLRDDLLLDIKEFSEEYNGRFVIVDMLYGIDYGAYYDINDYKSMTEVVFARYRDLIKKYNLTFLLIHHTNKSGNSLGSTAIESCVDGTFDLKDNGFGTYTFLTSSRDFDSIGNEMNKRQGTGNYDKDRTKFNIHYKDINSYNLYQEVKQKLEDNKKLSNLAGLRKIRIHDFRHSCASLLINTNASITLVANYLGNTKIDETLNTYPHMYKNSLQNIVDIMDNLN